ncbi:MAG: hypothetical protein IT462_16745 [Planctomycetes bacterium]|nr:hypothetical protein [Planctomycetota bacterium]
MKVHAYIFALLLPLVLLSGCTTTQPVEEKKPDALMASNSELRTIFNDARKKVLENETFVLVGGDELYFYRAGMRESEVNYTPAMYHRLKAIDHVPLSIYGLFALIGEGPYDAAATAKIDAYLAKAEAAETTIDQQGFSAEQLPRQKKIVADCIVLLKRASADKRLPAAYRDQFCANMRKMVLDNALEASRAQLEGLNDAMTNWMATLTEAERKSFHAVISLSHQAREENLQAQYFRALFGEPGPVEERIVLAEGVFDEQGMHLLLGTHILDGGASVAFFGDDKRLQRDLLADAAKEIIPTLKLPK